MTEGKDIAAGSSRTVLLLIAGIPTAMLILATVLWLLVERGEVDLLGAVGTANRGQLLQPPRPLQEFALSDQRGDRVEFSALEPQWTLLVVGTGAECAASCEQALYLTRQIHTAMGKELGRIRRIYVSEDSIEATAMPLAQLSDGHPVPGDFARYLEQEQRGLLALTIAPGAYTTLFAEHRDDPTTWYLVDPAGWIMMSYNSAIGYKDVISDLKFLLKNSGG